MPLRMSSTFFGRRGCCRFFAAAVALTGRPAFDNTNEKIWFEDVPVQVALPAAPCGVAQA